MTPNRILAACCVPPLMALLAACGGGSDADTPTDTQREAAVRSTVATRAECAAVAPFYWEIGDAAGARASGAVDVAGATPVRADTVMSIASASKWLYAAYVLERRAGLPTDEDVRFLTFRSGYTSFLACLRGQTVDECLATPAANGTLTPGDIGYFAYGGGHMQKHASLMGLGALDNAGLAAELRSALGTDIGLAYSQPQPAGGAIGSAQDYARFLRKLLDGTLRLGAQLGTAAVCTNPATCSTALNTPVPAAESWHYALGHWVEDDPMLGDGAFSSAGAFGFYPWVDATKRWYGVLARSGAAGSGEASVACGRLLRKAWVTGAAP